MFLGWVFNALFVGLVARLLPRSSHGRFKAIFYFLNLLVFGMLVSFPLQGYGIYSIAISTIHTFIVVIFCIRFFRETKSNKSNIAVWFARASLGFFLISAIGPFVVGTLVAKGLGQSEWYHLAVYFYLHFQYNGVFTFGILALLFHWMEQKGCSFNGTTLSRFHTILFISCFPAYALSTLWTNPPTIVYWVALLAALLQVIALNDLFSILWTSWNKLKQTILPNSRILLIASMFAFAIKVMLQLMSVHPKVAMLAYEVRFYVIAYLHLVLIALISFFLLAWYNEQGWIFIRRMYANFLIVGFVSSELIMISVGYLPDFFNVSQWLAITSAFLVLGTGGITFRTIFVTSIKY